jgi:hypothetical protein
MTPALVIIGAQKAGTSALFEMLSGHPKAAVPGAKEMDHFGNDTEYAKGMRHYLSRFPAVPMKSFGHFTFEASPSYMFDSDECAARIARDLPNAVCVAVLRDPVKRAYSAWNMYREFKGNVKLDYLHDPRSFSQAVEDEIAGRTTVLWHKYLLRGCYAEQMMQFKEHIAPERLLVKSYKDLKRDPVNFLAGLFDAINVAPLPAGHKAFNTRANQRSYPAPIDPGLAVELYRYFAPEMVKLRTVLGVELDILETNGRS